MSPLPFLLLLLLLSPSVLFAQDPPLPRELGRFDLPNAAFIEAYSATGDQDDISLYITTFNAISGSGFDAVYRLEDPGSKLNLVSDWFNQLDQLGGESTAYWPNYPVRIDEEVAGFDGIIQTSGFLVPTKTFGQLEVYNSDSGGGPWNIAALDEGDWSYHWAEFKDVDGDGLKDIMTARFNTTVTGQTVSQLLWMRNPGGLTSSGGNWEGWEQNVLIEAPGDGGSPDIVIQFVEMEADGIVYDVMVTAELWAERISLYYVEAGVPGAWADPGNIEVTVVDQGEGAPFEAHLLDLNADGTFEIVASIFEGTDRDSGNLFVYEQTGSDFRSSSSWSRTTIADGFSANGVSYNNKMSPGKFRTFYPTPDYAAQSTSDGLPPKPLISLSGDDDGKHYVLYPENPGGDRSDFSYELYLLVDSGGNTAGTMAVRDLDGDGYVEIVSAGYSAGEVYVHTYAP